MLVSPSLVVVPPAPPVPVVDELPLLLLVEFALALLLVLPLFDALLLLAAEVAEVVLEVVVDAELLLLVADAELLVDTDEPAAVVLPWVVFGVLLEDAGSEPLHDGSVIKIELTMLVEASRRRRAWEVSARL